MSDGYIGVNGVARKIKDMYVGVDGIARKVKSGYVGVNNVARCFYSGSGSFAFSGAFALVSESVTIDNAQYALYRLTESGVLTVGEGTKAWLCGGGAGGRNGASDDYFDYGGGGGGGGYLKNVSFTPGKYTVTIGAGGTANGNGGKTEVLLNSNSYDSADGGKRGSDTPYGGSGGSGGGGSGGYSWEYGYGTNKNTAGSGAGVSTYPFGLTDLKAHCAGGGGARSGPGYGDTRFGGVGGTNGGNGGNYRTGLSASSRAAGGEYGGGAGGLTTDDGYAATFYGGGGGGGTAGRSGGAGYQGCVYVAIPA